MKIRSLKARQFAIMICSASLLAATTPLRAGDGSSGGLYLNSDVGVNLMDNLTSPSTPAISFNPGLRWDVSTGYGFKLVDKLVLAPELETGILYNSLDKAANGVPISGSYVQVPLLANLVLNCHVSDQFVVYAGAGGGFDLSAISISGPYASAIGSETDAAWQVMAGIRYKFGGSSALGLGYKYLAFTPEGGNSVGNNSIFASYTLNW